MDVQAGEAGPFQSRAWLRHWLEYRGAGPESFPIVVDGGATVALFVRVRIAGLRVLRLLGSGDSDFNGLISMRGADAAWDSVVAEWRDAVASGISCTFIPWPNARQSCRHSSGIWAGQGAARLYEACPFIRLAGLWAQFIGARKRLRGEVRRWTRRLEEMGPLTFRSVKAPVSQEVLDVIGEIERDSWEGEHGNAVFKPGNERDFLFAVLRDVEAPRVC